MSNPVGSNPNAVVAGTSGGGGGALVVWILSMAGLEPEPVVAALIAGACATVALAVGKSGVKGVLRRVWKGQDG